MGYELSGLVGWYICTDLAKYRTPRRSISAWSWGGACTRWMLDLMRPPVSAVRASQVLMVMVPSIGFCESSSTSLSVRAVLKIKIRELLKKHIRKITTYHPLPVPLAVEDLQPTHGLAEEQGDGAQVRMAGDVQLADLLVLVAGARGVVHVPQVVLAADVVLVVADQLVLVGELEEDGEEPQQLDDDLVVAFLRVCGARNSACVEGISLFGTSFLSLPVKHLPWQNLQSP